LSIPNKYTEANTLKIATPSGSGQLARISGGRESTSDTLVQELLASRGTQIRMTMSIQCALGRFTTRIKFYPSSRSDTYRSTISITNVYGFTDCD
jgi:hypothetical protein